MVPKPLSQWLGLFALQDVHRLMGLQIYQNSAIGTAPPPGKLVHSQNLGRQHRELFLPLKPYQGVWAGYIAQEPTDPGGRFSVAGMD
jgi:hypothetical protein